MICYQDRTFCQFNLLCKNSVNCDRVLTSEIKKDAEKWWGKENAPICVYAEFPPCFVRFFEPDSIGEAK